MKTRILTAVIGLAVLFLVIGMYDTVVLNIAISAISVIGLDEMIGAAGYRKNWPLALTAFGFAALIPFCETRFVSQLLPVLCFAFALVLFCILLWQHRTLKIEEVSFIFFMSLMIPVSLTTFVYLRDVFGHIAGLFGAIVVLCGAWVSDTGAYFFGITFGKHKLAPEISPKKTVEGFLGGIVSALIAQILLGMLYAYYAELLGYQVQINYLLLCALSPLISIVSVVGDLSASVIKRQFQIKDFGKLLPGHGGVMDRFDSVLLVAPFVYILFKYLNIIVIL